MTQAVLTETIATSPHRARIYHRVDWLFGALLVFASLLVGLVHVPQHDAESPIDEYVHIDYVEKFPSEVVVRQGEETGGYARKALACRGIRTLGYYPPELCRTAEAAPDSSFPYAGVTTADIYTPLYFGVTWLMAQPLQWLGVHDLTAAARATGWVWLAGAAVLLYLSLRRLSVRPWLALGLGLLAVGSLAAYWANTYVSTDATSLLAGSAMLWSIIRYEAQARGRVLLMTVFATVATLLKLQNYGAVAIAVVFLLIRAAWSVFAEKGGGGFGTRMLALVKDSRIRAALLVAIVPAVCEASWYALRSAIKVGPTSDLGQSTSFGYDAILQEMFKFFTGPAFSGPTANTLGTQGMILGTVLSWVIVSGVLGAMVVERKGSLGESLAASTFGVAILLGPALAVAVMVSSGYYFTLPPRYGASLIPFYLACAGLLYGRKTWIAVTLTGVCLGCYILSLFLPAG